MRKKFIHNLKINFRENVIHTSNAQIEYCDANTINSNDSLFESINFKIQDVLGKVNKLSLDDEIDKFLMAIDLPKKTAFNFFSQNREKYSKLAEIMRIILSLIPSPYNGERAFLKALFFIESR